MNELLKSNKTESEIIQSVDQKKELSKLGSYRRRIDGGRIYRFDRKSNTMILADYKEEDTYDPDESNRAKLVIEKNSIYIEALNKKNAYKRLIKGKIICAT